MTLAKELPPDYTGRRFDGCYHCLRHGDTTPHVKSGACWTGHKAKELGNQAVWIIYP